MTIVASSPTLGDTQFFQLPKRLTKIFSPTEVMVLQQLHSYLHKNYGKVVNGVRWIYNTYEQWQSVFPGLTARQIRYAFKKLREWDVVIVEQLEKHIPCGNRRNWYTLDYEVLNSLLSRFFSEAFDNIVRPSDKSVASSDNIVRLNDKSVASSIYTENTNKEFSPEINNSTEDAVDSFFEEESLVGTDLDHPEDCEQASPTGLTDSKTPLPPTPLAPCDNNDICTRDFEFKLYLVMEYAGIPANKKLEQQIDKYSCDEVEKAVDCYREWQEHGKTFTNPAGWLVDCLRGQWWTNSPSAQERRRVEALIGETLAKYGYSPNNPEEFAEGYWKAVEQDVMHDFDETQWVGDRAGYLLINEHGVWVRGLNDALESDWIHWNEFRTGI